jgi:cytochrome c-type biogenesis protein CcmF
MFILVFLVVMIGGALSLYGWRAPLLKSPAGFDATSRDAFLLYNNIVLVLACLIVFVGTLAPLINDALRLPPISVGADWFNNLFPYPALMLVALVGFGIHAAWKHGRLSGSRKRLIIGAGVAVILGVAFTLGAYGPGGWLSTLAVVLGCWVIVSSLFDPIDRWRRKLTLSRAVLGMTLAHVALGICIIALATVETYSVERDVPLAPGETVALGRYAYRLDKMEPVEGPNYEGQRAQVTVLRDGRPVAVLYPENRFYWVQQTPMTEAGIESRWNMDLFAALGGDVGGGRWSLRAQIRPLINYVWLAAGLMALGGILAASDRRYRSRQPAADAATTPAGTAEAT